MVTRQGVLIAGAVCGVSSAIVGALFAAGEWSYASRLMGEEYPMLSVGVTVSARAGLIAAEAILALAITALVPWLARAKERVWSLLAGIARFALSFLLVAANPNHEWGWLFFDCAAPKLLAVLMIAQVALLIWAGTKRLPDEHPST